MSRTLGEKLNPILGIAHLFLLISSLISLKNVTNSAISSKAAFTFSLIYSIVGVLFYTHPNPVAILRKLLSIKVSYFVQLLLPLLFVVDVLRLTEKINFLWGSITTIVAVTTLISLLKSGLCWRILSHGFAVWNVALLAFVAVELGDECYWTVGLIILISLNQFVFIRLPTHYEISRLEISTVGLSFFVVFALNSINEIAATSKTAKEHILNGQTW